MVVSETDNVIHINCKSGSEDGFLFIKISFDDPDVEYEDLEYGFKESFNHIQSCWEKFKNYGGKKS